jgi:hypothetical protein
MTTLTQTRGVTLKSLLARLVELSQADAHAVEQLKTLLALTVDRNDRQQVTLALAYAMRNAAAL